MNKFILLPLIIISLCLVSCEEPHMGWIDLQNAEGKIWTNTQDTTLSYCWEGNLFESVANGNGILKTYKGDSLISSERKNIFYGAVTQEDVESLSDGSKYVGLMNGNDFEGFGVYIKNEEIYIGNFKESKPEGLLNFYKNGKIYYEGNWHAGAFNGEGTLHKEDGSIKTGDWENGKLIQTLVAVNTSNGHYKGYARNGQPDGLGEITYSDGTSYKGHWKDGKWTGEGLYLTSTDSIYGVWKDNKIEGDVIYRTPTLLFEGSLIDNMPMGPGNLTTADGSFYSGNWINGKRSGLGDMVFPNGDYYSGEWEENAFNGYGKYSYNEERASYDGDWKNGLKDGYGYYRSPQFAYRGEWEKGWMDGDGFMVFANGDKYEGSIHENIIDGVGCYTYRNGNRYEGEFINGMMGGIGVFQFQNGNRFEGEFVNNKIYGDGTLYVKTPKGAMSITGFWPENGSFPSEASIVFENGDLYEGPIVNGCPTDNGSWTSAETLKERTDKVSNSIAHKSNEFYKKHRAAFNYATLAASGIATAISKCGPLAPVGEGINIAVNAVDASLAIASAAIDVKEANDLGEDATDAKNTLTTEISMNVAMIAMPKVLKVASKPLNKALKNVVRSKAAQKMIALTVKGSAALIVKKSALRFIKGKIIGKRFTTAIIKTKSGARKVEGFLYRNVQKPMIAIGRLFTTLKRQAVTSSSLKKFLSKNPKSKFNLDPVGSGDILKANMRMFRGIDKFMSKNERIRRWLKLRTNQVEAHHIIPSKPKTAAGRNAKKIWEKYFTSVNHPCNGIMLGRSSRKYGYKFLAKGSNHTNHGGKYEEEVSKRLIETYNKFKGKYANNPEMMQKLLLETMDDIKKDLYKGRIQVSKNAHMVHTVLSIFKDKPIVKDAFANLSLQLSKLAID